METKAKQMTASDELPEVETTAEAEAEPHNWPYGSLSFELPDCCEVVAQGPRMIYQAPGLQDGLLDGNEVSHWNQLQYELQIELERWQAPPELEAPTDSSIDVGSKDTTRAELVQVLLGDAFHTGIESTARHERFIAEREFALRRLLWTADDRRLYFIEQTGSSGKARVERAQARLKREAAPELLARMKALADEVLQATYKYNERGQQEGHMLSFLKEQIALANRKLAPDAEFFHNAGSTDNLKAVESDRRRWQAELTERQDRLNKAEAEMREIEARMLSE